MKHTRKIVIFAATTLLSLIAVLAINTNGTISKILANNTYSLTISTTNPIVDSKIRTEYGNNIYVKADSNSGVSFNNETNKINISSGGYIQNLSALNGLSSVEVSIESGSLELFYSWEEPNDLNSPEYSTNYVFTSSGTYNFGEFSPSHFRLKANSNSILNYIRVSYQCAASLDNNIETVEYDGLENSFIDAGELNSYATTSYAIGDDNTLNESSKRSLKLSFKNANSNLAMLDFAHNVRENRMDANPNFSKSVISFAAKFSSNITNKDIDVCATGDGGASTNYVRANRKPILGSNWNYYNLDLSLLSYTNNTSNIRLAFSFPGVDASNKNDGFVLLDDINYGLTDKYFYQKSETVEDSWENAVIETSSSLSGTYCKDVTFGRNSRTSLLLKRNSNSKDSNMKYCVIFNFTNEGQFLQRPNLAIGQISFNYKPVNVNNPEKVYMGFYQSWSNFGFISPTTEYVRDGWYKASVDLSMLGLESGNTGIRMGIGWDINDENLDKSIIYLDNLHYSPFPSETGETSKIRGVVRSSSKTTDIPLSQTYTRSGTLAIDYKYINPEEDQSLAFSLYLGESYSESYGNFKFYYNKMNDNGSVDTGVTFTPLADGYNRVVFDLATISKKANGASGAETFSKVMFRWFGPTQGVYLDVEPTSEATPMNRGVLRSSSNYSDIVLSQTYTRSETLTIDYKYVDSTTDSAQPFSLYLGIAHSGSVGSAEYVINSYGNFKFYYNKMNDNGSVDTGVTFTPLADGYNRVVFDLATISKKANGASGAETFSKVMFRWFGPTQGVYLDVEPTSGNINIVDCSKGLENASIDDDTSAAATSRDFAMRASRTSINSLRLDFSSNKEVHWLYGKGCTFNLNTTNYNSISGNNGILKAKILYTHDISNKAFRLTLVDENQKAAVYDIDLSYVHQLGDGWYQFEIDFSELPAPKYELDVAHTGENLIRLSFGFYGINNSNYSTAKIWLDDIFYEENAALCDSYSNGTIWQAYETETVLQTASTTANRVVDDLRPLYFEGLRNDIESTQLMIKTNYGRIISDYSFTPGNLFDENGNALTEDNFEVLIAKYIYIDDSAEGDYKNASTYGWQGFGYYPDAIVPQDKIIEAEENTIASNKQQSIWINVNISENTPSGTYVGNGILSIDGVNYSVPMKVKVHKVALPSKLHNQSCFQIWHNQIEIGEGDDRYTKKMRENYADFLLNKKVGTACYLKNDYFDNGEDSRFIDFYLEKVAFDERVTTYRLPIYGENKIELETNTEGYLSALVTKNIELYEEGYTNIDLFKKAIIYYSDEPGSNEELWNKADIYEEAFEEAKANQESRLNAYPQLKQSFANIPNIVTTGYTVDLNRLANIDTPCFIYNLLHSQSDLVSYQNQFRQVWWYGCILPVLPYVAYQLDSPIIGFRLTTCMQYVYGIDGEIYAEVNHYQRYDRSTNHENVTVDVWSVPQSYGYGACDQRLMYPGKKYNILGPISTMRLEELRAGREDYECYWLLNQMIDRYNSLHGTSVTTSSLISSTMHLSNYMSGTQFKTKATIDSAENYELYRRNLLNILDELYF